MECMGDGMRGWMDYEMCVGWTAHLECVVECDVWN